MTIVIEEAGKPVRLAKIWRIVSNWAADGAKSTTSTTTTSVAAAAALLVTKVVPTTLMEV